MKRTLNRPPRADRSSSSCRKNAPIGGLSGQPSEMPSSTAPGERIAGRSAISSTTSLKGSGAKMARKTINKEAIPDYRTEVIREKMETPAWKALGGSRVGRTQHGTASKSASGIGA